MQYKNGENDKSISDIFGEFFIPKIENIFSKISNIISNELLITHHPILKYNYSRILKHFLKLILKY